jgi:hypothetical protein
MRLLIIVCLLVSSGCSPERQKGDIAVGSSRGGIVSTQQIPSAIFESLYGVELDGPNGSTRKDTLVLAVVVVFPRNEGWIYTGGGSIRPWHQYIYRRRWMHFPLFSFTKPESNGDISSSSERRDFVFEYDGRRRLVTIAGKEHAVRMGELIFIQFDDNWEPHVTLAKETLKPLPVSSNIGEEIERQLSLIL